MPHSIAERKRRWTDFLDKKRHAMLLIHYDDGPRPWPYPEHREQRIEYALRSYAAMLERSAWLDDDRVPYLNPYSGTEIFARAFGCGVHYPGDNMPFALPMIRSADELRKVKPVELMNSPLTELFEIAGRLREAAPDAVMARPDIQSPLDIAALIWEKADLLAAMVEEPDAVLELINMTEALLTEFVDAWITRYGCELVAHYPDYYMPHGFTCSEDEVGVISPALFETFSLPSLNRLSGHFGRFGMHCCAHARHQWEGFKQIQNLQLINFVQPPEVLREAYDSFRAVCGQMHSIPAVTDGPEGVLTADYPAEPSAFVVLQADASAPGEARAKCGKLRELSRRFDT